MSLRLVLRWLTQLIVSAAILSTSYLYLYPFWFGCAFPSTTNSASHGFQQTLKRHLGYTLDPNDTTIAPFRLLVLADPQLEGDSSLPDPEDALLSRLEAHRIRLQGTPLTELSVVLKNVAKELVYEDIPRSFQATRKTLDLFGNDYYLAHIYRTLHWWSDPTHVTVLGDLIGSQWVSDDEFERRGWRFWNRVFAGSRRVPKEIMESHILQTRDQPIHDSAATNDKQDWSKLIMNTAGNHDIGYAGDISKSRIERFERAFGKVNWDLHFSYPPESTPQSHLDGPSSHPSIHVVILNSMLLDTPPFDQSLQTDTYDYINSLITNRLDPVEKRNSTFVLLLTHVPLHKPEGTCVDPPFIDHWDYTDTDGAFKHGGLREQNHLSEFASHSGILQSIFGMSGNKDAPISGRGRNGLILTGHDHEGCDVVHYIERETKQQSNEQNDGPNFNLVESEETPPSWSWKSVRTPSYPPSASELVDKEIVTSLREVTLRSMMGEFGGNAGLLSLWYDFTEGMWKYKIQMCPLGIQHVWWAVHVVDLIAVLVLIGWTVVIVLAWRGKAQQGGFEKDGRRRVKGSKGKVSVDKRAVTHAEKSGDWTSKVVGRQTKVDEIVRDADAGADASSTSSSMLRSSSQRRRKG